MRSPFHLSGGPMRAEHDHVLSFLRRGDARELLAAGPIPVDLEDVDPRVSRAARRIWGTRMIHEHQSAAVFARLLPQLMACGAPLDFQTTAMRMAADELHHGALCKSVVEAFGGDAPTPPTVATRPLPEHEDADPLEGTFRNVLFVSCLAETIAVAFTTEEREQTEHPWVRAVIGQISADEVLHARFGWAFVKEVAPELSTEARDRTSRWLRLAFAYLEREEMLEVPDVTPPSEGLRREALSVGVCDNQQTRALFYETVREVIVPGLEAVGLAAERAWQRRRNALS
ncbi:MAG: ferritin-like domain-containing protein [Myxococcales bacterium]|nr:ferritin-like domain-containing protein [Myxococcales bacterium]